MNPERVDASLVIPCFNEAGHIERLAGRCGEVVAAAPAAVEIILVDNGSTDATPELLPGLLSGRAPYLRSVRVERNQGYGFGILSGLRAARGDVLGWCHADLQTDPGDFLEGLERFRAAPDPARLFVKGRRYGRAWRDVAFTWGMSLFELAALRCPLWDINAQPNLFHRAFFDSWRDPPHDFSLDLFAYYSAVRAGFRIERFPVYFGRRASGIGHNDTLAAKLRYSRRTVAYSLELRARIKRQGAHV